MCFKPKNDDDEITYTVNGIHDNYYYKVNHTGCLKMKIFKIIDKIKKYRINEL